MLEITSGQSGLRSLIQRALVLDENALVRASDLGDGSLDIFVTTPFQTIAARRVTGTMSSTGTVFRASDMSETFAASWPGALPPISGYQLLDDIPTAVVSKLAEQGQALARQFSGPLGPPSSLLEQEVITVDGHGQEAHIPMRMIFTCTALGLIPGFSAPADIPRHLRVSVLGRWTRLDAPFGSVYRSTGLPLLFS
ncbi:Uncharacterised protein [Corynebacterium kutscheri]|uniref:Uncharacterized protein n=1 Tax=Corynebacterium kutscheri TaxID=35755 RepID=A0A0F6TCK0_9CORY|nr:hypothetical protein [Corynebacterium kutscheri]AKE40879.1 hypothetical protein UL82_03340 [Corynebacterium kutscheri]VEH06641.1 Uncharacterised protein [Corynebacterium kutscheri]VEH09176.1 Uncharacterised protein [Corynebacterium kutscheri]VEH82573.1 Uncharacterised protein [Corynebacterium kutscheri]